MAEKSDLSLSFDHLNSVHSDQMRHYLKFFTARLSDTLSEIDGTLDDIEFVLESDLYTSKEVHDFIEQIRMDMKKTIEEELEKWITQSALFVRTLFLQAEGHAISMKVDVDQLEHGERVEMFRKLNIQATNNTPPPTTIKPMALDGISDVKLVEKIKDLQESNRGVLAKLEEEKRDRQTAEAEKRELAFENTMLKEKLQQANRDKENMKNNNKAEQQEEIEQLRRQGEEMKKHFKEKEAKMIEEIKTHQTMLSEKLDKSPQFQQLKKMLKQKNQQLREARAKSKQQQQSGDTEEEEEQKERTGEQKETQ